MLERRVRQLSNKKDFSGLCSVCDGGQFLKIFSHFKMDTLFPT